MEREEKVGQVGSGYRSRGPRSLRLLAAAAVLVVTFVSLPFPQHAVRDALADDHPDRTPPGQLTRRAVAGRVVANDGSSISVETRFGLLLVNVTSTTVVHAYPEKDVDVMAVLRGDKVVIHLDRSSLTKPGDASNETGTSPSGTSHAWTVTARGIHVVPARATRSHQRAVEKCSRLGRREVIRDDGTVTELNDESHSPPLTRDPSTSTTSGGRSELCDGGDDLILLLRKRLRNSDEAVIRARKRSAELDERLAKIVDRLEGSEDTQRFHRAITRVEERASRQLERLEHVFSRVTVAEREDIERALIQGIERKAWADEWRRRIEEKESGRDASDVEQPDDETATGETTRPDDAARDLRYVSKAVQDDLKQAIADALEGLKLDFDTTDEDVKRAIGAAEAELKRAFEIAEEELRRAAEAAETTSPSVDSGTLNNIGVETSRLDDGSGTGSPSEDTATADATTADGVVRAAGASSY